MRKRSSKLNRWEAERQSRLAASINAASSVRANSGLHKETKPCFAWKHIGAMDAGRNSSRTSAILTHHKIEMRPKRVDVAICHCETKQRGFILPLMEIPAQFTPPSRLLMGPGPSDVAPS